MSIETPTYTLDECEQRARECRLHARIFDSHQPDTAHARADNVRQARERMAWADEWERRAARLRAQRASEGGEK